VPVYSDRGRDGGYALLDSYRTTLTGLTEDEVRALFMLSIPAPLQDLGVGQELKAAMRKLAAALPDTRRDDEVRVRQRFHLDATWWFQGDEPVPHLQTVHDAVWQDRKLYIAYRLQFGQTIDVEQVVEPYGLVAKASVWYVVYAQEGRVRARRISHLLEAQILDEPVQRPAGFDLAVFWEAWCAGFEASRPSYPVRVRVAPHLAPDLTWYLGAGMRDDVPARVAQAGPPDEEGWLTFELCFESLGPPDEEGWLTFELCFESLEQARSRLLGLGGAVEVLEPEPLRLSVADYGRQVAARYGP
jgi:predicted DNA-binding transcriptional regulator YafY